MDSRSDTGAFAHNEEPSLEQLLASPSVRLMMASDRVEATEVRRIAAEARKRGEPYLIGACVREAPTEKAGDQLRA
jgi:hypothetical protein